MKKLNQSGSHIVAILLVVVVIVAVGAVGYYVYKNKDSKKSTGTAQTTADPNACDSKDENICKFYASWKNTQYYTVTTVNTSGGQSTNSIYQYVLPDKYHLTSAGDPTYEIIGIGDVTYTKDAGSGTWYKQTTANDQTQNYQQENTIEFEAPTKEDKVESKSAYKFIGMEQCGNFQCFKYQVNDPSNPDAIEYIWFDNQQFLLRKTRTESGSDVTESLFNYDPITIAEPSPVKELGPDEVYIPGQGVTYFPAQ